MIMNIHPGQTWVCRDGKKVTIDSIDGESCGREYPIKAYRDGYAFHYTTYGKILKRREHDFDLIGQVA